MSSVFIAALLFTGVIAVYQLLRIGRRPPDYPPGPPALPLIGNLHQIPSEGTHLQFQKWAQEYGPIYSLMAGSRPIVVLNTDDAVKELFDRRGSIYSSRPDSYIIDVVTGGTKFGVMPYNDTWKKCRAVCARVLDPNSAKSYVPYQDLEVKQTLNELLHKPELFVDHLRRYTNSLSFQIVFGFRVPDTHDPNLTHVYESFDRWTGVLRKAILFDLYPSLRHLPDFMVPLRKTAKAIQETESGFYLRHWHAAKEKIENGDAKPCLAKQVLKAQKAHGFPDKLASALCGDLIQAASDTTANQLTAFIQAMILFPEVQRRAREEIDRVCGEKLPTVKDAYLLPYVRACVKETLRWMPTALLGIPHSVTQNDEYMGYRIPKNAIVMMNTWAIHMDPNRHAEPRVFDPLRYIEDHSTARESAVRADPTQRDHFGFGAGRRLCPGIDVAENGLYLGIARILWAFDITAEKDAYGRDIIPDPEKFTSGMACSPQSFPARITPRDQSHAKAVLAEWELAQDVLDRDDKQWRIIPHKAGMESV
ncbi:cytochrome P450 [Xylariaceae sp. FL0255]|nr:cytochrome P450 [Xylariaceae sp. FL0255]